MLAPGANRQRLAKTLNSAYAEGLLSEHTLAHRLDVLFASAVIDPAWLVGDLPRRGRSASISRRVLSALKDRTRRAPLIAGVPEGASVCRAAPGRVVNIVGGGGVAPLFADDVLADLL